MNATRSAHIDSFARDNLPPADQQPEMLFDLPSLQFPPQLNCATELLDRHVLEGRGDRTCILAPGLNWTYRDLQDKADRIAHVLTREMGLVPGNRVLLRAPNNPMLAACWFAVMKAGAIAVATMPLLRAKELKAIIEIGRISHALCDLSLADELREASIRLHGQKYLRTARFTATRRPESACSSWAITGRRPCTAKRRRNCKATMPPTGCCATVYWPSRSQPSPRHLLKKYPPPWGPSF